MAYIGFGRGWHTIGLFSFVHATIHPRFESDVDIDYRCVCPRLMVRHERKSRTLQKTSVLFHRLVKARVTSPRQLKRHVAQQYPQQSCHHATGDGATRHICATRGTQDGPSRPQPCTLTTTHSPFIDPKASPTMNHHSTKRCKSTPTPFLKHSEGDITSLIASASEPQLSALLQKICGESKRARKAAERALRQPAPTLVGKETAGSKNGDRKRGWVEDDEAEGEVGDGGENEGEEDPPMPKSKLKPRATCRNCGSEYLPSGSRDGGGDICVYHPGA